MVIFSVLCEVKPNRDQSPGFFFINWELKLDSRNLTTVSVSSVIITCWKWALAGVSRPASGTDTRELVHFIHTCPTIQAWSRCTLIDVWERSTEKRVERVGWFCSVCKCVSREVEWSCTQDRKQAVTSACSQLAAPHQALLTSPALRSHHFITRVTQEVDLMAHTIRLTKLPPIGGCLKFSAGTFMEE